MTVYVPEVAPKSAKDIEEEALRVRSKHYPRLMNELRPFPILDFFDHVLPNSYGLDTGIEELSDGVEGMTYPDGRVLLCPDTYRRASYGFGRDRFTVAHECYHGIEHRTQIRRVLIDTGELVLHRRGSIAPFRDPEWQADSFAGALLMPRHLVYRLVEHEKSQDSLLQIMNRSFGVSLSAAEVRLSKLSLAARGA